MKLDKENENENENTNESERVKVFVLCHADYVKSPCIFVDGLGVRNLIS